MPTTDALNYAMVNRLAVERFSDLTDREREVACLVAKGLANKEIASRLGISLLTVKDYVHHILVKSGLRNRTEVALAYQKDRKDHKQGRVDLSEG